MVGFDSVTEECAVESALLLVFFGLLSLIRRRMNDPASHRSPCATRPPQQEEGGRQTNVF